MYALRYLLGEREVRGRGERERGQWYGTRAGRAVRFNCIRAQTFNIVVYGEYTENCKLPFTSTNRNCNYLRIEQE